VREGVPEKGDLRCPALGGTIFVGVFLGLAAAVLSMGRKADLHLPRGGNLIAVRINKHREHARTVVDDLIADRERASLAAGRRSASRASKSSRPGRRVACAASRRDQAPIWTLPSTAGTTLYLESWNEAPPRPDPALARPSRWTRAGTAAAPCCRGRRCFGSAGGGEGVRGVLPERRACPPSG
jgi:hypothetical protein